MTILELHIQETHFPYDHLHTQEDFNSDLEWPMNRKFYLEDHRGETSGSGRGGGKGKAEEKEYKDEEESEQNEDEERVECEEEEDPKEFYDCYHMLPPSL